MLLRVWGVSWDFFCRRKQIRDAENIANLKKAYQAGSSPNSSSISDIVQDYELSSTMQYPQPMSNTAYQSDSYTSNKVFEQVRIISTNQYYYQYY